MAAWPKLNWDKEPQGPLKGVKVVDMATVVLGPLATLQLADMGAEVIKIENDVGNTPGDMMRYAGASPTGDLGPVFAALNRNKKALNLNVKEDADKAILTALLEDADIFIHNVRMAGMERLGFGYEAVKAINPDIIYVHCAGFGPGGAYSQRQAYDDLIQAASGFAALFEQRDGTRPSYAPSLLADKVCGLFAAQATLAALYAREKGAGGQFVQVPMFESFTWFHMIENLWGETYLPGNERMGYTRSINPRRRPYPTSDGFIAIVPYNDRQWARFFELGGRPGVFDDPRFSSYQERTKHVSALYALIEEISATRSTEEWLDLLDANDIPAMRYNRNMDVLTDPHMLDVALFEERKTSDGSPYRSMRHPILYSDTPASVYGDPRRPDEDGDEIRTALGFGDT